MLPTAPFELSLSDAAKEDFERDGFVRIPRITSDEEAAWFRSIYDRLLADRLQKRAAQPAGLKGLVRNTLWIRLDRWETLIIERTSLFHNAERAAACFLGVDPASIEVGLRFFFKPANGGGPVPWHQDEAHHDPAFDHRSVNVWVPLDEATKKNGCLWYIPGSHLGGIRVHRHPGHGAPEVALMTDDVPHELAVPVELAVAAASFHHCRTLHASGLNESTEHRRALVLVCSAPPVRRAKPDDRPWLSEPYRIPEVSF